MTLSVGTVFMKLHVAKRKMEVKQVTRVEGIEVCTHT